MIIEDYPFIGAVTVNNIESKSLKMINFERMIKIKCLLCYEHETRKKL